MSGMIELKVLEVKNNVLNTAKTQMFNVDRLVVDGAVDGDDVSKAVSSVSTGNNTFTISGDYSKDIEANDKFKVTGSTGNDGTYTVSAVSVSGGNTTLTTTGVTDSTADGTVAFTKKNTRIHLSHPFGAGDDTYVVDRMPSQVEKSWEEFNETASNLRIGIKTKDGTRLNGKPKETLSTDDILTIFDEDISSIISAVNTSNNWVEVRGNIDESIFNGDSVKIAGSTGNNGTYTVDHVVDSDINVTRIYVTGSITNSTADGNLTYTPVKIHFFEPEKIKTTLYEVDDTYANIKTSINVNDFIETGITAKAGGGQSGAYELSAKYSHVETVGTAGDSVKLPVVTRSNEPFTIKNDHATKAIDVFPPSGGNLGSGSNTAESLAAGATITYISKATKTFVGF